MDNKTVNRPPRAADHPRRADNRRARSNLDRFRGLGALPVTWPAGCARRPDHERLGAWLNRPLDTIARKDVEQCFHRLTREAGRVQANNAVKVLQALYRRQCIDVPGLHNPVEQWKAVGGRLHVRKRRRIVSPAKLLPRRHRGFETAVRNPVARDAFRFGIYTCMRRAEVFGLAWAQVDMDALTLRIGETKAGEPLGDPRHPTAYRHPRAPPRRSRAGRVPRAHPRVGVPLRH